MARRILVTGGAGFLGSHLCQRLLALGNEVICLDNFFTGAKANIAALLDNRDFEIVRHDVIVPFVVECDQIYHLACPASPIHYQKNPVRTIRTAVQGTLNMLDLAREVGARMFISSTSEVYGDPEQHPQLESYWGNVNPIGPRACYDEGKRCAEALAVSYARQYNTETRIARIFNTYGPHMHQNDGRVVSNFIVQALRGEALTLYGDGSHTRSFCYVDDLIEGFIKMMATTEDPGPVNLGNPTEHSIQQLADLVLQKTGTDSKIRREPLPVDDPTRRRPDISYAKEVLDWSPTTTLEQGLERTIEYFRKIVQ